MAAPPALTGPDGLPVALCVLSRRPWQGALGALLAACEELVTALPAPGDAPLRRSDAALPENSALYRLMAHLGDVVAASPGRSIQLELSAVPRPVDSAAKAPPPVPFCVSIDCPRSGDNPAVDVNLAYLIKPLGVRATLKLLAALLNERRILVVGSDLTYVSCAVQAARVMLYPLEWQHAFHPLLPSHFVEYVTAPMPFVAGIHSSLIPAVQKLPLDEVAVINLDEEVTAFPNDKDVAALPAHAAQALQSDLQALVKDARRWDNRAAAAAFRRFFLRALGNYRMHLRRSFGEMDAEWGASSESDMWFDVDAMERAHRSRTTLLFLACCRSTQAFERFVMRRLEIAKGGYADLDLWEREVSALPEAARNADKDAGKRIGKHVGEAQRAVAAADLERLQQATIRDASEKVRWAASAGLATAGGGTGSPEQLRRGQTSLATASPASAAAEGGYDTPPTPPDPAPVGDLLSFDGSVDDLNSSLDPETVSRSSSAAVLGGDTARDTEEDLFGDPPPDWEPFGGGGGGNAAITAVDAGEALAAALGLTSLEGAEAAPCDQTDTDAPASPAIVPSVDLLL